LRPIQNYMQLTRPHIAQLPVNNLVTFSLKISLEKASFKVLITAVISERITVNPLVQNALGAVPTPNHNCCAICGCAFRLTTDLVQHMRLNHRSSKYKRSQKRIH
uniref:C2H2-type domain-containing protein n=1 Tax=Anisakis simplex TaxID=6269 RepID=A0A0M3J6U5_ANISI